MVMTEDRKHSDDRTADKALALCRRIEILTGQDPFNYSSHPTKTTSKYVFQNRVCLSAGEALAYAQELYADAYREHQEVFGPFDKDATEQVSLWINNDGDYYDAARLIIRHHGLDEFMRAMAATLDARETEAVRSVRAHLSRNDMDRIEWFEVACDLFDV